MKGTAPNPFSVTNTDEYRTGRRLWWLTVILAAISSVLMLQAASAYADAACPAGATMNIVAHPDDDLLFQSPDLLHDVQAGKCVRTVYITAGERGGKLGRLQTREAGVEAAYARMAGVANSWTTTEAGVSGHPMPLVTLTARPTVSLVFMRLPEGFWGDGGTAREETLQNLWLGNVSQIHVEDGSPPDEQMVGAANPPWTATDGGIPGQPTPRVTLTPFPTVPLALVRLPEAVSSDGGSTRRGTLPKSWLSTAAQLHPEDQSSTYTKSGLIGTLTALMTAMQPDTIRAQDYVGTFGDGDHDDHHAAAYFARSAQLSYDVAHTLIGYTDYATSDNPQNVFGPDLTAKTNAYNAYLAWDSAPCGVRANCGTNEYSRWLKRQYVVKRQYMVATEPSDAATPLRASTGPI